MVAATKGAASHQSRLITQAISSSHQQLPCHAQQERERERERETSPAQLFARRETSSPPPITSGHRLHHIASPSTAGSLSVFAPTETLNNLRGRLDAITKRRDETMLAYLNRIMDIRDGMVDLKRREMGVEIFMTRRSRI